METIAQVIGCIRKGTKYHSDWEKTYVNHVPRALYKENLSQVRDKKKVEYNFLCKEAKLCQNIYNKSFLHKVGSKDSISDLHKFILFYLMENIPFDLPHTIYINILHTTNTLGGYEDILYSPLVNKILWEQGVYQIFNIELDE